jgi:hypothetical protein
VSATQETADAKPAEAQRERAPQWFLWMGLVGAVWFIWLMVESGLDLNTRAKVGELVKLAQSPTAAAALAAARGKHPLLADFAVDPNGAVRLRLKGEPQIEGKLIAVLPQAIDGKVIGWRCESDAPRQFLPRICNTGNSK